MRRRKFTTLYVVRDGKLMFWNDDDNGSCLGSYPELTCWMKNIQADKLMEALGVNRIENLGYALFRLPGRDDIERLKSFCEKHDIDFEYSY